MYILTRECKQKLCQKPGSAKIEQKEKNTKTQNTQQSEQKVVEPDSDEYIKPNSKNTYTIKEVNVKKSKKEKKAEKKESKKDEQPESINDEETIIQPPKPKPDDGWQVVKNKKKNL